MSALTAKLKRLGACQEAIEWCGDRDAETAWNECPRGDWLLWISARMIGKQGWPTHQEVVLAACACAATALRYVPAGDDRPRRAIVVARKWERGEASIEEVRAAAYAASAAYAADAAASAAYAAASAAYAAAAAYTAAAAADADALDKSRLRTARVVRRMLKPTFAKVRR